MTADGTEVTRHSHVTSEHGPLGTIAQCTGVLPLVTRGDIAWEDVFLTAATVAMEEVELRPMTSALGSAVVRLTDEQIVINRRRLRIIYQASATPEKKDRDKGASGMLKTDFPVEMSDYQNGRYGD